MKAKTKASLIAAAAQDKKALDVVSIDMRKMRSVCEYFVLASGASTTQVRAIADHIVKTLKDKREKLWHAEGMRQSLWVLLDFGDAVAHVFLDETRRFYDLERLWSAAPQVRYKDDKKPKRKAPRASARQAQKIR